MPQPVDIFELMFDLIFRCLDKLAKLDKYKKCFISKFFTLELDMMVGAVLRTIPPIILVLALNTTDFLSLYVYSLMWFIQAIYIKFETFYIFDGKSDTKSRELYYKIMNWIVDSYQIVVLANFSGLDDLKKLVFETVYSFSGLYKTFIISLVILDSLEIIYLCICNNCRREVLDFFTPGQAQYFVIFRLIGGVIGTIVMLIFYLILKNKDEHKNNKVILILMPILLCSEFLMLIPSVYQLCRERQIIQYQVDDMALIKQQQKMKKWYCIIIGLTYGLSEVAISTWVLYYELVMIIQGCICCCNNENNFEKKFCSAKILSYEITLRVREVSEQQLTININ